MAELTAPVAELKTLLPVLLEKEKAGLIKGGSHAKAVDLVRWAEAGRLMTEPQNLFVGRLLNRAKRRSRGLAQININATAAPAPQINVDAIVDQVIQQIGILSVDPGAVALAVDTALEKRVPRRVEITIAAEGSKPRRLKDEPRHSQFERLIRAATTRVGEFAPGIFMQGEASSGKTTGCRQAAEALGLAWHFNGAISMPHEMLGFIDGAGKYHRTPFREAYEKGGWYTFDEVDRSDPVALLAVNPHLANGVATFPDKQVKRHRDCIITCTANTWGLGADANYSGATKLDAAFLSRFPVRIAWDIDPVLEEAIVGAGPWLNRVRAARQRARAAGLRVMIDVRAAQAGAALIAGGFSQDEAASMTYLANLKPEQRRQVEGSI